MLQPQTHFFLFPLSLERLLKQPHTYDSKGLSKRDVEKYYCNSLRKALILQHTRARALSLFLSFSLSLKIDVSIS